MENRIMPRRVLLVNAAPLLISRYEDALRKEGYSVFTCSTVKDAVLQVRSQKFDVVVTDITFFGETRVDIVPLLKVIDSNLSVIVSSDVRLKDEILQAVSLGADDFFIHPKDLLLRVKLLFQKAMNTAVG